MKILLTMNLPYTRSHGGTNRSNRALAEGLQRAGHEVHVVVPALPTPATQSHAEWIADLQASGIEVVTAGRLDLMRIRGVSVRAASVAEEVALALADALQELAPDWVLVSAEDPSQTLLKVALEHAPERVIYLAHTPQMFPFGPQSLYPSSQRTALIGRVRGIMTISAFVRDYIKQWSGFTSFVCHPQHYGAEPFQRLGATDRREVMMMNPCRVKGIDVFVKLAERFADQQFSVLQGYGTTSQDVVRLTRHPNVRVRPNCEKLDDALAGVKILVMPSLWAEGFGMAAVDAMLRGIPVLASDYAGLQEATAGLPIRQTITPITEFEGPLDEKLLPQVAVPPQDMAPWYAALERLLQDDAHYESVSGACREAALRFVRGCSVEPLLQQLAELGGASSSVSVSAVEPSASRPAPGAWLLDRVRAWGPERLDAVFRQLRRSKAANTPWRVAPDRSFGPASFAQRRLWFLEQLGTSAESYNVPVALELHGPLDAEAFEASLDALIQRHDTLRTAFEAKGADVYQRVYGDLERPFQRVRLQGTERERRVEALRLATVAAGQRFDLARPPLYRVLLLELDSDVFWLVATFHHTLMDGWALSLLLDEWVAIYTSRLSGRSTVQTPAPFQFIDFAYWERHDGLWEQELAYWKRCLTPPSAQLELGHGPRPGGAPRGEVHRQVLPASLMQQVSAFAGAQSVSPYAVLLSAFQCVLSRYSGQHDLSVGSPLANRKGGALARLIGPLINTVVLRQDISQAKSFIDLVQRNRSLVTAAQEQGRLPFEKLVEELQPERGERSPLFQVMFIYDSQESFPAFERLKALGLSAEPVTLQTGTAKFELTLAMTVVAGELCCDYEYRADLYSRELIVGMGRHLASLLSAALAYPTSDLSLLAMLEPTELEQIQERWSGTGNRGRGGDQDWLRRLDTISARQADEVAIWHQTGEVTYASLRRAADTLANALRQRGVGPDVVVGVCHDRSPALIICLLAILKAGGAYLPLDPKYPQQRLKWMIEESQARLIVTSKARAHSLAFAAAESMVIDEKELLTADEPAIGPPHRALPDHLSHIIYTSGSTGKPKGVGIRRRSVNGLIDWALTQFPVAATRGVIASTSANFDLSVFELFWPLCAGGRVILIDSALEVAGLPATANATLLNTVPAACAELVRTHGMPGSVRTVCLAGEPLTAELVENLYAQVPVEKIYNLYGPSEDTTYSTVALAERGTTYPAIGAPVEGSIARVLDSHLRPVPVGVQGELYLGGTKLARGYVAQPGLTAERFLPDPYGSGERLYRTGDLVRWQSNGQLLFLGRADNQVKIRGHRVEPEEVAALLRSRADVKEAVVVARKTPVGAELSAYVVPTPGVPAELTRRPHQVMPNGLKMFFQRKTELDHFYEDIFVQRTYAKHGLELAPGDVVLDVGANVGTFSLFALTACPDIDLYAFEPVPVLAQLLRANIGANGFFANVIECGLGAAACTREITFYPNSSGMSSFYADDAEEREVLRWVFRNEAAHTAEGGTILAHAEELLDARLDPTRLVVPVRTLSDVIDEKELQQIALLKVDVQKSELDVLQGIEARHWPIIERMVVEVHDFDGRLKLVEAMLERQGFVVKIEQDPLFSGSVMYNVYAQRPAAVLAKLRTNRARRSERALTHADPELEIWLKESLPSYLLPATITYLPRLPRTPNGKVDRARLPEPRRSGEDAVWRSPGTELETILVSIVAELLQVQRVNLSANFFELGGHSLLLLAFQQQLRTRLGLEVTLSAFFEHPTIARLAAHLAGGQQRATAVTERAQERAALRHQATGNQLRQRRGALKRDPGER